MFAASKTAKAASAAAATDPQFPYVTMLLHGDGTNGAQNNTFLDSSTNNFTITRNGNTTQGTFTPYGSNWSNYFSSNSGLTAPNNSAFKPAANDFTVEAWIFSTSTGQQIIYGDSDSATNNGVLDLYLTASGFLASDYWTSSTAVTTRTSTLSPTINQWNHVLVSRTGTTMYIGLNGVLQSFTAPSSYQSPATIYPTVGRLGAYAAGVGFIGYISNFRYINGTNLYSGSTYTVPTAPLTAITNTVLLTSQSNRFIDNSTNSFALTVNGSPSVQRFSPFSPTTAYSTSVIGGSGYFNGSAGNYLEVAYNSALDASTGPFTYEAWLYPNTATNKQYLGGSVTGAFFAFVGSGTIFVGRNNIAVDFTSSTGININAWNHVVIVRNSSNNIAIFINGKSAYYAASNTNNYGLASNSLRIGVGTTGSSYEYNGYINDVKIAKSALYDPTASTITVPTAPLTAGSAGLLASFTNAGILDNAMMNDLETVGNAQISTSVKKYGTGSLYFDGTGDYLQTVDSPNVELGSGNFTLEAWIYPTSLTSGNFILSKQTNVLTASAYAFRVLDVTSGANASKLAFYASSNGSTWDIVAITATTALSINTWYHVAVTRSGSSFTIWLNGVSDGTGTSSTAIQDTTNPLCVGAAPGGGGTYTGYIDDLRITKGVARYTSTFTPPTAAFPNN